MSARSEAAKDHDIQTIERVGGCSSVTAGES